ncbi:MAG: hypothetical protein AAF449_22345, partial [Myxococcota bacterium]
MWPFIFLLLIGLGAYLRLLGANNLSLWVDEAIVVDRLAARNDLHLYFDHPLWHRPFLYLLVHDFIIEVYNSELAVRSLALMCGIATPVAIVAYGLRAGWSRRVTAFTALLAAVNPYLINLSKDFKPYAIEAFISVAVLAAFAVYRRDRPDERGGRRLKWWILILTAPLLPLFGYPALFVSGALLLTLFILALRKQIARSSLRSGPLCALTPSSARRQSMQHDQGRAKASLSR